MHERRYCWLQKRSAKSRSLCNFLRIFQEVELNCNNADRMENWKDFSHQTLAIRMWLHCGFKLRYGIIERMDCVQRFGKTWMLIQFAAFVFCFAVLFSHALTLSPTTVPTLSPTCKLLTEDCDLALLVFSWSDRFHSSIISRTILLPTRQLSLLLWPLSHWALCSKMFKSTSRCKICNLAVASMRMQ